MTLFAKSPQWTFCKHLGVSSMRYLVVHIHTQPHNASLLAVLAEWMLLELLESARLPGPVIQTMRCTIALHLVLRASAR